MTIIVGLQTDDNVILGADSALTDGWLDQGQHEQGKIFKPDGADDAYIASCGSPRVSQVIKYKEDLFHKAEPTHEDIVTKVADRIRRQLKRKGTAREDDGIESMPRSSFLIAYKEKIFTIYSDLQVAEYNRSYDALGIGSHYALGSFYTTQEMGVDPKERVLWALAAASHHNAGCAPPFKIQETDKDEQEVFSEREVNDSVPDFLVE